MSSARALGPRRAALFAAVLAVAAIAAATAAAGAPAGAGDALAYLLPVLVLLGALALRCYPGERVLLATIAARRRPRVREARGDGAVAPAGPPPVGLARGGALLGAALAVRPPPPSAPVPGT